MKLQAPLERDLGMEDYLKVTRFSYNSAEKTLQEPPEQAQGTDEVQAEAG